MNLQLSYFELGIKNLDIILGETRSIRQYLLSYYI